MVLMYSRIKKKLKDSNWVKLRELPEEDRVMIKKVMKSLGIFRVNSFDAQLILKDLIGMSQEMELRDSSLKEEIGEDLTGYVNALVENSKGAYPLEYIAKVGIELSIFYGLTALILGWIFTTNWIWRTDLTAFVYVFIIGTLNLVFHLFILPRYQTETGLRRRIPDLILVPLVVFLVWFIYGTDTFNNQIEVNMLFPIIIFGIIYVISKLTHLWTQKQLIEGREHLVEE